MPFRNGVVTAPKKARNTAAGPGGKRKHCGRRAAPAGRWNNGSVGALLHGNSLCGGSGRRQAGLCRAGPHEQRRKNGGKQQQREGGPHPAFLSGARGGAFGSCKRGAHELFYLPFFPFYRAAPGRRRALTAAPGRRGALTAAPGRRGALPALPGRRGVLSAVPGRRGPCRSGERPAFFAGANTPQRRKRPASPFLCGRLCSLAALRRDHFSISSRAASLL